MTRPRGWRHPASAWAARLALPTVVVSLLVAGSPAAGQTQADQPPTLPPVQIAVLVDESGSLTPDGVAREKEAARTIALGAPSPDTTGLGRRVRQLQRVIGADGRRHPVPADQGRLGAGP